MLLGLAGSGATLALNACVAAAPRPAATGGDAATKAPETTTAPAATKVKLRWSVGEATDGPTMLKIAQEALPIFRDKHPNIELVPELPPGKPEQVLTQMIAGTAPDVLGECCERLPAWAAKGQLVKLDDYVKKDLTADQIKDYPTAHWDAFANQTAGRYAMPQYMGSTVLYYNKKAFDAAGVKYPDDTMAWKLDGTGSYEDAMRKLTNADKKVWGAEIATGIDRLQAKLVSAGGNWVDPKDAKKAAFDSDAAIATMQWLYNLTWKDKLTISNASAEKQNRYQLMESGKIAMFETGDWAMQSMLEIAKNADWDVAQLPQGPVQRNSLATTDGWTIWSKSQAPDAGWEVLKFLQSNEWYDAFMKSAFVRPSRLSLFDKWTETIVKVKPELGKKNLKAFRAAADNGTPLQIFHANAEATEIIKAAIETTLISGSGTDVKAVFTDAAKRVNDANAKAASLIGAEVGGSTSCGKTKS
jgi:multiple sugar transport system substrate-binding protein